MQPIDRVLDQIRQHRRQLRATLAPRAPDPATAETRLGLPLSPGARVFDTISGMEGEIVGGTVENIVVQPAKRPDR